MTSFQNLLLAARKAQRGKRMKAGTAHFNFFGERELLRLQTELRAGTYRPGAYRHFTIREPKPRLISAAPYRDRVVHHAFCNVVEPLFERRFIHDSYACRLGKGTHRAVDRAQSFLRANRYVLQCDVRKYFPSVVHGVLMGFLARKISDGRVLGLARIILASWGAPQGLPIGNLTSQFFANVYLDVLDRFMKVEQRQNYYVRYMDDFLVFGRDKTRLARLKKEAGLFLRDRLRLDLHSKKAVVSPGCNGLSFLGFRLFRGYRRLRPQNVRRFVRRMRTNRVLLEAGLVTREGVARSWESWRAYAVHADAAGRLREAGRRFFETSRQFSGVMRGRFLHSRPRLELRVVMAPSGQAGPRSTVLSFMGHGLRTRLALLGEG